MVDGTLKGRRRGMSRPRGASAGKVRFMVRGEANCCKQCLTPWHKEQKEEEYWGGNFGGDGGGVVPYDRHTPRPAESYPKE